MLDEEYFYQVEYINKLINGQEYNLQIILLELSEVQKHRLVEVLFEIDPDLIGEIITKLARLSYYERNQILQQILLSTDLQEMVSMTYLFYCAYSDKEIQAGSKDPLETARRNTIANQMYEKFKPQIEFIKNDTTIEMSFKIIGKLSDKCSDNYLETSRFTPNPITKTEKSRYHELFEKNQLEDAISEEIKKINQTTSKIEEALSSIKEKVLKQSLEANIQKIKNVTGEPSRIQKDIKRENCQKIVPQAQLIIKEIKAARSLLPKKSRLATLIDCEKTYGRNYHL